MRAFPSRVEDLGGYEEHFVYVYDEISPILGSTYIETERRFKSSGGG